jgi:hypothetical protein
MNTQQHVNSNSFAGKKINPNLVFLSLGLLCLSFFFALALMIKSTCSSHPTGLCQFLDQQQEIFNIAN